MKKLLCLLAGLPLLTQCAAPVAPKKNDPAPPDSIASQFTADLLMEAIGGGDVSKISVPILRAPGWGQPKYEVAADGSYIATYNKGKDYAQITGTPRTIKPTGFSSDGSLSVLGKSAPYFATGNEDPEYRTEPVILTAPDGRTATYSVLFGGPKGVKNRAPKVAW